MARLMKKLAVCRTRLSSRTILVRLPRAGEVVARIEITEFARIIRTSERRLWVSIRLKAFQAEFFLKTLLSVPTDSIGLLSLFSLFSFYFFFLFFTNARAFVAPSEICVRALKMKDMFPNHDLDMFDWIKVNELGRLTELL